MEKEDPNEILICEFNAHNFDLVAPPCSGFDIWFFFDAKVADLLRYLNYNAYSYPWGKCLFHTFINAKRAG